LAANPKMKLLNVVGDAFRDSMLGANRFFLTQCHAKDASQKNSIPIIGLATWKNGYKYRRSEPYALLAADFDQSDGFRDRNREWTGKDQSASIAGTIDETLRALREVEGLEIARAKGFPLKLDGTHRWVASDKVPEAPPMQALENSSREIERPARGIWQIIKATLTRN